MTSSSPWKAVAVYTAVVLPLACVVAALLRYPGWGLHSGPGGALVLAAMWIPALGAWVATRTVDRGWSPPLRLKIWGRPRTAIVALPLVVVVCLYGIAYSVAALLGVDRGEPAWQGAGTIAANLAFNLPLLPVLGLVGAIGEELGWRGYLQPRLDLAGVRGSLAVVIVIEILFHLPIIAVAGYVDTGSIWVSIGLFSLLKLGATPVWTWGTYRLGSLWVACWFHSLHNGFSQVLFPKLFGAGSETVLAESGLLPDAAYLLAAVLVGLWLTRRGESWQDLARTALVERGA